MITRKHVSVRFTHTCLACILQTVSTSVAPKPWYSVAPEKHLDGSIVLFFFEEVFLVRIQENHATRR